METSSTEESVLQLNSEDVTSSCVKYQHRLNQLKTALLKAQALQASINNGEAEEQLYGRSETAQAWRLSFLNFSTLRESMQMAESTNTLIEALGLESESAVGLLEEERDYVKGVLEEKGELAAEIVKIQAQGQEREFQLLMMRTEKAELDYKTKNLLEEVKELRLSVEGGPDTLTEELKKSEGNINQMRFMCQKTIMSHDNAGLLFDDERNAEVREFFMHCGKTPEQLREEFVRSQHETPGSAVDM